MKRALLAALALASTCCSGHMPLGTDTCAQSLDVRHPSVVRLTDSGYRCSGVVIAAEVVVTAAHCVNSGTQRVQYEGETYIGHPITLIGDHDAMLLRVERLPAPLLETARYEPDRGDPLTLVGYGCGDKVLEQRRGRARAVQGVELAADMCVCGGDSGGAVLDNTGRLVGIVRAGSDTRMRAVTPEYWEAL